ncbi:MAG: alpha/beta hydrolase [Acidimicrobiia bacterium]
MDERLRELAASRYRDGQRSLPRWKGSTSVPAGPHDERETWFAMVERRRSLVMPVPAEVPGPPAGVDVTEVRIPVTGGDCGNSSCTQCRRGSILARVYRAHGAVGRRPLHINFHGGAFWLGGGEEMIRSNAWRHAPRSLAIDGVCIDVDYRMAPEHKYPVPGRDCYQALCWIVDNASTLGVDVDRVAIGGASAGGALSAAVALMARDEGGPPIAAQVLEIPVIESACNTLSMHRYSSGFVFERGAAMDMWSLYLSAPSDAFEQYASPGHATDLSRLPPAIVTIGEYDPLRDEGLAYASRLEAAGVPVAAEVFPMCHGAALPETAEQVEQFVCAHLERLLTGF